MKASGVLLRPPKIGCAVMNELDPELVVAKFVLAVVEPTK